MECMMRLTEIFDSVQGEGPAMGLPCTFVRFSGCNLRCGWCDTPQSSWTPEGRSWTLGEVLSRVGQNLGRTVVLTGGEPFIHAEFPALCQALRQHGHPVHLETAGTVFLPVEADLVCISPKLAGSAPDAALHPDWHSRHESLRHNPQVVARFLEHWPQQIHFKFVVENEADIAEVHSYLAEIGFRDFSRVSLMPQCRNVADLDRLGAHVASWCVREGFRYSDRLHVRLWPGESGR